MISLSIRTLRTTMTTTICLNNLLNVRDECPARSFLTYRKLLKNRPREQDFDARRTSAEVKAGSARFFNPMFENGFALHKIRAAAYKRRL